jgi:hypothetical protein
MSQAMFYCPWNVFMLFSLSAPVGSPASWKFRSKDASGSDFERFGFVVNLDGIEDLYVPSLI